MIDPKLLTEENGFAEGVVVEYETIEGDKDIEYFDKAFLKMVSELPETNEWFASIRPITGPMAIWNFAPEWASLLIQNSNGWFWMNHRPDELAQSDVVTYRPFWARTTT